jgi:hypothetical protein
MRQWYSSRGARNGLLLALVAIALWFTWAFAYVQFVPPQFNQANQATLKSLEDACCQRRVEI